MIIQISFVVVFALNMFLIWLSYLTKKAGWFRIPGALIFSFIPFFTFFFPQPQFELDYFWWKVAGVIAICAGFAIAAWAEREMRKSGERVLDIIPRHLFTAGPYAFIRHPHYTGLVLMWVGWWWVWASVYSFYFGMFILLLVWLEAYLEEKLVYEKLFADQFQEYRKITGMFWVK
jgi:protein-S-isoprenylcysteine O-methyltransferase Ste14